MNLMARTRVGVDDLLEDLRTPAENEDARALRCEAKRNAATDTRTTT